MTKIEVRILILQKDVEIRFLEKLPTPQNFWSRRENDNKFTKTWIKGTNRC